MEERAYWLAWSCIPGVGPVLLKRLQQHFGTLSNAWKGRPQDLRAVEGVGPQTLQSIEATRSQGRGTRVAGESRLDPEQLLDQHQQVNPWFWTPADPDYPQLLLEIPDPPPVLYYQGKVQPKENQGLTPVVAIVGTRDPSDYGKRWTQKIAAALAQKGFTIVSGLAEGIDTQAHRACLEAGGRTLAVLGTGVDVAYPARNQGLYQQILAEGLVLSEYPAGTQPGRAHFPRRNRIIAGLSRAVLLMEAPSKSGALITAHLANDYCRDVYVLPGSLDNSRAMGCLGLVNRGAQVILNEGYLLEALGAMPRLDQFQRTASAPATQQHLAALPALAPELEQVFQVLVKLSQELASEPIPFDLIVQNTNLGSGLVSGTLLQLELLGLVCQTPGMRYQPLRH